MTHGMITCYSLSRATSVVVEVELLRYKSNTARNKMLRTCDSNACIVDESSAMGKAGWMSPYPIVANVMVL